jgi:hypothetical protein
MYLYQWKKMCRPAEDTQTPMVSRRSISRTWSDANRTRFWWQRCVGPGDNLNLFHPQFSTRQSDPLLPGSMIRHPPTPPPPHQLDETQPTRPPGSRVLSPAELCWIWTITPPRNWKKVQSPWQYETCMMPVQRSLQPPWHEENNFIQSFKNPLADQMHHSFQFFSPHIMLWKYI